MAEKQYALVHGDQIVTDQNGDLVISGYEASQPEGYAETYPDGCRWLLVENYDEPEPFDVTRHYRAAPRYEVDGDEVHRVFEVKEIGRKR